MATPRPSVGSITKLRSLLLGGDRRSLARSKQAWPLVQDASGVAALVALTRDGDWLVVMRAMDLLEKVAHKDVSLVQPHRALFLGPLSRHQSWEIQLQVARALALFRWTRTQRARAVTILRGYLAGEQLFVRAWALDSLATLARDDVTLRPLVAQAITTLEATGKKSLLVRAREARRKLALTG